MKMATAVINKAGGERGTRPGMLAGQQTDRHATPHSRNSEYVLATHNYCQESTRSCKTKKRLKRESNKCWHNERSERLSPEVTAFLEVSYVRFWSCRTHSPQGRDLQTNSTRSLQHCGPRGEGGGHQMSLITDCYVAVGGASYSNKLFIPHTRQTRSFGAERQSVSRSQPITEGVQNLFFRSTEEKNAFKSLTSLHWHKCVNSRLHFEISLPW